jgi:Tol biopolymer transport system component
VDGIIFVAGDTLYRLEDDTAVSVMDSMDAYMISYATLSPGGRQAVFPGQLPNYFDDIYLLDLLTLEIHPLTEGFGGVFFSIYFSPDGKQLAFLHRVGDSFLQPYLMNADGSGGVSLGEPLSGAVDLFGWSPDGEALILSLNTSGSQDYFLLHTSGELEQITFFPSELPSTPGG